MLDPLKISPEEMRLGRTLPAGRAPGEVSYYHTPTTLRSVFPPVGSAVPRPYGGWNLEAMGAHNG